MNDYDAFVVCLHIIISSLYWISIAVAIVYLSRSWFERTLVGCGALMFWGLFVMVPLFYAPIIIAVLSVVTWRAVNSRPVQK